MMEPPEPAPQWDMAQWLNTGAALDLAGLRGRVVLAAAFQMLCPGCVEHTIPQLRRAHALFPQDKVAVVGLHTVFEHHEAMGVTALAAFLHEYRVAFPVGIDRPDSSGDPIPATMRRYRMQGTPTIFLIDRDGRLRRQVFGHVPDMELGAEIMALMRERAAVVSAPALAAATEPSCSESGCAID